MSTFAFQKALNPFQTVKPDRTNTAADDYSRMFSKLSNALGKQNSDVPMISEEAKKIALEMVKKYGDKR